VPAESTESGDSIAAAPDAGAQTALVSPQAAQDAGPAPKLLLWDIDGTILTTGSVKALQRAVRELYGDDSAMADVEVAGRTDSGIARQILARYGRETSPANQTQLLEAYLRCLEQMLPTLPGKVFPGVIPLLDALQGRSDIILGLLTGNLARGAELKLRHYGVWHYFGFGAFADDHHARNELGRFATARVLEKHGLEIPGERIYVIGDTPHDIACGRAIGARTVAVTTGIYTAAQLSEYQPDHLFADFSDWQSVLAVFE
jgi:phosphoglycolate phosphatase